MSGHDNEVEEETIEMSLNVEESITLAAASDDEQCTGWSSRFGEATVFEQCATSVSAFVIEFTLFMLAEDPEFFSDVCSKSNVMIFDWGIACMSTAYNPVFLKPFTKFCGLLVKDCAYNWFSKTQKEPFVTPAAFDS